jgi:thiol-disulfide isomerase/thioredoxin
MEWTTKSVVILVVAVILSVILIYMLFRKAPKETYEKEQQHVAVEEKPESKSDGSIFLFYGDFCGHCQKMKPEWEKLKSMLPESIHVYEMESKDPNMAQFGIKGFPTIRLYRGEPSPTGQGIDYTGNRTAADILHFIESNLGSHQ